MKGSIRSFLEAVVAIVVTALFLLSTGLRDQRDTLSTAYEQHLVGDYEKTICQTKPRPSEIYVNTEKDEACIAGIKERAKREVTTVWKH